MKVLPANLAEVEFWRGCLIDYTHAATMLPDLTGITLDEHAGFGLGHTDWSDALAGSFNILERSSLGLQGYLSQRALIVRMPANTSDFAFFIRILYLFDGVSAVGIYGPTLDRILVITELSFATSCLWRFAQMVPGRLLGFGRRA